MEKELAYFHAYRPLALIRVIGDDAFNFLQGQFTNDLRQQVGGIVYGLWLNQKGKVLADTHVLRRAEGEFSLFSVASTAAVILQRLEEYIVADDVQLVDGTSLCHGLAVGGDECGARLRELLGALPGSGCFWSRDDMVVFPGRRTLGENYEIVGPVSELIVLKEKLGAIGFVERGVVEVELARIAAGIPSIPRDIGPGDLPNEGELEDATISYTKGCYLGQEIMARLKNMGQVRRHLVVVRGSGDLPAEGTPLYQGAKKVGEIRTAAPTAGGYLAMAMLSRLGVDEAGDFGFAADGPMIAKKARHE